MGSSVITYDPGSSGSLAFAARELSMRSPEMRPPRSLRRPAARDAGCLVPGRERPASAGTTPGERPWMTRAERILLHCNDLPGGNAPGPAWRWSPLPTSSPSSRCGRQPYPWPVRRRGGAGPRRPAAHRGVAGRWSTCFGSGRTPRGGARPAPGWGTPRWYGPMAWACRCTSYSEGTRPLHPLWDP